MTRRQFLALLVPLLLVLAALTTLLALERAGVRGAPRWDGDFAQYVRERMAQEFPGGAGDDRQMWRAYFNGLNAYVQTYDAHAEIVPPWRVAASREQSSGQYTGIGVRIETGEAARPPAEGILVTGVKPGGPAAAAGVLVGDRIVAVDGRPIPEILASGREDALQAAIRGAPGTPLALRLRGADGAERETLVVRAEIDSGSVFGARFVDRPRGIGYVRIRAFEAGTERELRAQLGNLEREGLSALILDLRGNAGGLMDQAVAVADLFLDSGVILRQRGRSAEYTETYHATPKGTWNAAIPLAVLVNGPDADGFEVGSASASEILAGTLQDHRRAVLVGERSWGKFMVQIVEEVPTDAGPAIFKRTTSIYETPLGHHYQRAVVRGADGGSSPDFEDPLAGLEPDLLVPLDADERRRLARVFSDEFYADWDPRRPPTAEAFVDRQIEAARALLAGEPVYPRLAKPGPAE